MNQVEQALRERGCVYTDDVDAEPAKRVHLQLASGKHSNGYVNIDPITPHPRLVTAFSGNLFDLLPQAPASELLFEERLVVIGPEKGVNAFLYRLATQLDEWRSGRLYMKGKPQVFAVVVEKKKLEDGKTLYYVDRDGHAELCQGSFLIGVEDVSTTGGSLGGALQVGIDNGGTPAAGVCIWNRGAVTAEDLGLPEGSFRGVVEHELPMWEADACPLCETKVPMALDLGHGEKFQAKHPGYEGGWNRLLTA